MIITSTIRLYRNRRSRPKTPCMACCSVPVCRLPSQPWRPNSMRTMKERSRKRVKTDPHADPAFRAMLGDLEFADKKSSPGCQAADLMLGGAIRQERTEHG